jgi:Putative prokaryotic signal transducing protein
MDQMLTCVFVANGEMQAQQVRAFLEAEGVSTLERGESLRNTHGLTLSGLGAVEILVAADDAEQARSLLSSAESGAFRLADADEQAAADETPTASEHSKD